MPKISIFYLPRPFALVLTGAFMALILFTSTRPSPQVEGVNQNLLDHVLNYAHFPVYALLTFLLILTAGSFDIRRQAIAVVIAVGFGILNEIVQLSTPGRSASLHDVLLNTCGAFFTIVLINCWVNK